MRSGRLRVRLCSHVLEGERDSSRRFSSHSVKASTLWGCGSEALCGGRCRDAARRGCSGPDEGWRAWFIAGPRVVSGGLLWSGARGVSLASMSGGSRLLARGASLSDVVGDRDWIAVSDRRGVRAARLGGRLVTVGLLHRCPPVESPAGRQPRAPLVALVRADLYAVIGSPCLHGPRAAEPELVRVQLARGGVRVLARIPAGAMTLAASGARLALTYPTVPRHRTQVDVRDAANGRSLFSVSAPANQPVDGSPSTQIDSVGDVLVTGTFSVGPSTIVEGWWGNRHRRVGQALEGLQVGNYPEPGTPAYHSPPVAAALSDGRLAYATYANGSDETIAVRDLATNTTRTVVSFPGSAGVLGVGLQGTRLGWAQQSLGFTTSMPCVTQSRALGPVQLVEASVEVSRPIIEVGAPVPPRNGPICPPPP